MNVSITIVPTKKQQSVQLKEGATVSELLKELQYKTHATIVLHNNTPVPDDELIIDGEEYQVIPVASGG